MPSGKRLRRREFGREGVAFHSGNGGGGSYEAPSIALEEVVTDALLVTANLCDVNGVAVDGTATHVDNTPLADGLIVLRAFPGGDPDNGLYIVRMGSPWERYRTELHRDGLVVVVTEGTEAAATATSPLEPFGGYQESFWQLTTKAPITIGTTALDFRQVSMMEGTSIYDDGGGLGIGNIAVPPLPAGKIVGWAGFFPDCDSRHIVPLFGAAGTISATYSGLYRVSFSILCSHATGGVVLAVGLFRNGIFQKELIRSWVDTTDLRFHGGTNVRIAGDDLDTLQFRLYDPAGVGFILNVTEVYADIDLVTRR